MSNGKITAAYFYLDPVLTVQMIVKSVQKREKSMCSKTLFPSPQLGKRYNKEMGGVDLMDQFTYTYCLDRSSKTRRYLCLFFNLWVKALVNTYIVYGKLTQKKLSQRNFQVIGAKSLIGN